MNRLGTLAALTLVAGCKCGASLGPLVESPPGALAQEGFILEQPGGEAVSGAWITVSGWAAPSAVTGIAVAGAPIEDFYMPTGHVGIPTVPVTLRSDGRFFAPRVPLQEGATTLTIIPLGPNGAGLEAITRTLQASETGSVPATLVLEPGQPEPGQPVKLRAATASSASLTWQWDFDGDGTFDLEAQQPEHAWPEAGRYGVTARTKVNGEWVCAWAEVTVGRRPEASASTDQVLAPSRLFVIPRFAAPPAQQPAGGAYPVDDRSARFVAAIDGDEVKVFDPALQPQFVLSGLTAPSAVAGDPQGRLYVADTGGDRIVRFLPNGQRDLSFAGGGAFTGTAAAPLRSPVALAFGDRTVALLTAGGQAELLCVAEPSDGGPASLGDWTRLSCTSEALAKNPAFARSKAAALGHAISRPSPVASISAASAADFFLVEGKVLSGDDFGSVPGIAAALDAAAGPASHEGEWLWIDAEGTLVHQAGRAVVARWAFDQPLRAVAVAPDGTVYVAGRGFLRALDGLRAK